MNLNKYSEIMCLRFSKTGSTKKITRENSKILVFWVCENYTHITGKHENMASKIGVSLYFT